MRRSRELERKPLPAPCRALSRKSTPWSAVSTRRTRPNYSKAPAQRGWRLACARLKHEKIAGFPEDENHQGVTVEDECRRHFPGVATTQKKQKRTAATSFPVLRQTTCESTLLSTVTSRGAGVDEGRAPRLAVIDLPSRPSPACARVGRFEKTAGVAACRHEKVRADAATTWGPYNAFGVFRCVVQVVGVLICMSHGNDAAPGCVHRTTQAYTSRDGAPRGWWPR